jgi:hypothetical protein
MGIFPSKYVCAHKAGSGQWISSDPADSMDIARVPDLLASFLFDLLAKVPWLCLSRPAGIN